MSRLDNFDEILNSYEGRKYESRGRCKNLCLIVDSSGSIPPETFEKIKEGGRKAIAEVPDDGYCAVLNFSSKCKYTPWTQKRSRLDDIFEVLDTYYGEGSYGLTADTIKSLPSSNPDILGKDTAILLVTDGKLTDFDGVSELFAELTDKGCYTGLIVSHLDETDNVSQFCAIYHVTEDKIVKAMEDFAKDAFTEK